MPGNKSSPVQGETSQQFEPVRRLFESFWQDIEVGAGFCVYYKGEKVIDLWGGYADRDLTRPWQADTLVNVYSATKGMATLAFAILVGEGRVKFEDKVVDYWPEFGAQGKQHISIAQLFSHQAGLCGVETRLEVADLYNFEKMTHLLAAQKPLWQPGQGSGYHAVTWGYFPGELIRRITGQTLVQFFDERVRKPLNADFYIGLPQSEFGRCADLIGSNHAKQKTETSKVKQSTPARKTPEFYEIALLNPAITPFRDACSKAWRSAEIAASNGHGSAQGLAKIYAALSMGGQLHGNTIVTPEALKAATQLEVSGKIDKVTGTLIRRSRGFILNTHRCYGPNSEAFGHAGAGGSMAYADPKAEISFAYVMNQMQADAAMPRSKRLTDAVYECIKFR